MTAARHLIPIDAVAEMLAARIQALARELLPHGKRQGAEWVAQARGERTPSLSVRIAGAKAGVWADFGGGARGDALDLVAHVLYGGDKRAALRWARAWLGLEGADPAALAAARTQAAQDADRRQDRALEDDERARRNALGLWLGAQPRLAGTPVETYLRGRGIALAELGRQPRALRFHPGLWHEPSQRHWPAMVAAVTDLAGRHVATHRTWLELLEDGRVRKAPVERAKMVLGGYAGAAIRLARGASGRPLAEAPEGETVDLTEGIEDGLSVACAAPECRVLAALSLSNLGTVALPPTVAAVRLWLQNDTNNRALLAGDRAISQHLAAGRRVLLPDIPSDFKDVNDMLRGEKR